MNFADVKEWRIPEGDVIRVTDSQNRVIWQKEGGPDYTEPFYVENITNNVETLKFYQTDNTAPNVTIQYSTDKTSWLTLGNTYPYTKNNPLTKTLSSGEKIYLRSSINSWADSHYGNKIIGMSKVGGNIMSLIYGRNFTGQEITFPSSSTYNLSYLFGDENSKLIDSSKLLLPAITLKRGCYEAMFSSCSLLTTTPALPATTLAQSCYADMFFGCDSLTTTPALPATTLARSCYNGMFASCDSLTTAPILPATTLADYCYQYMFRGCTSLTSAPSLPATALTDYCYNNMFRECTLLNEVTCYATSGINENSSTTNWLSGVASTGTFTKAAGSTWPTGTSGIPSGWTVVNV